MTDMIESVLPTVIGGAVALKFLDVATQKRGNKVIYVTKKQKAKKRKKLKKVI